MGKYETKAIVSPKKAAPVKKQKEPFKRKWRRFWRNVRKSEVTKQAVLVYVVSTLLLCAVNRFGQAEVDRIKYTELMENQRAEIVQEYEAQIEELRLSYDTQITNLRLEYENMTPEEELQQEAEYIARVLYGNARNNSERDQRTLVWCILNRVDSPAYPNTVKEVCQQAKQWMGYSDDNPILNNLYEVAKKELETWHSGYRPVNLDYIYMSWSSKEIVLRDTYEIGKNTRYWQAG